MERAPYLFVMLLAVRQMVLHPARTAHHGLLAAACTATRFVGVSVAMAAAWVAFRKGRDGADRACRVILSLGPSAAVVVGWSLLASRYDASVRQVRVYEGLAGYLGGIPRFLMGWAAPGRPPVPVGVGLLAFLAVLGVVGLRRSRTARTLALIGVLHAGVVVLSRALVDPVIPLDGRMMAPAIMARCAPWPWARRP